MYIMLPITVRKDRVPMDIIIEKKFKQHIKEHSDTNKQFQEILIQNRFRYYIKNWTNKQFTRKKSRHKKACAQRRRDFLYSSFHT